MTKPPAYRHKKDRNTAVVSLTDSITKLRRDYSLGEYDTPQSRERYHQLIAEWEAFDRRLPTPVNHSLYGADRVSVAMLISYYWQVVEQEHQPKRASNIKVTLRLLRKLDGSTPIASYGPKRLRLAREAMIKGDAQASPPHRPWLACPHKLYHQLVP